ncbi:ribokinase [Modestobacter sp. I12A-02628]|uniref:Ribokinase n=1 Tax=Goekera deserti TaxID=2497753 RepID=A0A7K3WA44_9ACTN|nr:ribokinase [Goekera deserti]MPR00452.1 ribokinase [Goekera deserti]NDI49151.1 ribokinase [Goekera deserti]NEL52889.1 ribokinase [Goekera deserti]
MTAPGAGEVVVVGSVNVDQVVRVARLPAPGETLLATGMTLLPGGKGANQAVAAARLGAATTLVGAVGDDSSAAAALPLLRAAGVDVTTVEVVPGPTGLAIVTVDDAGENSIVVVPGANTAVDADAVSRHAGVVAGAAVVVLQGEIPAAGVAAAARAATGRVLLNLAPVIPLDPSVVRLADPLVVNEHEAGLLLEQLAPGSGTPSDDAALVAALRAQGIASVALTRGAAGAICSDADGTHTVPAPTVRAVDTSGAGDAFVGALAARLAVGASLLEAVQLAVRVGAHAVQGHGTQPSYPTLDDALPEVAR